MKKRVLVTGAPGFLGSDFVRALAAQPGIEIVADVAQKDWRAAAHEQLADLRNQGYPWPRMAQAIG